MVFRLLGFILCFKFQISCCHLKIRCHGGLRPVLGLLPLRGLGSLPGQEAEIPRAAQLNPKIEFRSQMKRCLLPESGGSLVARVPFSGVGVVDGAIWPSPAGGGC